MNILEGTAPMTNRRRVARGLFWAGVFGSALLATVLSPVCRAQETAVELDPAQTKIEFELGSTLHTVHGSFALKSGAVRFDLSTGKIDGQIVVDATSGNSGNDGRDKKMHHEVLESVKFPEVTLLPKQVKGTFAASGSSKVEIVGQLRLRGKDHDVTIPADVTVSDGQLTLVGRLSIPYVQWGLKDPSTFILRAAKSVDLEIHASGRIGTAEPSH